MKPEVRAHVVSNVMFESAHEYEPGLDVRHVDIRLGKICKNMDPIQRTK